MRRTWATHEVFDSLPENRSLVDPLFDLTPVHKNTLAAAAVEAIESFVVAQATVRLPLCSRLSGGALSG
jgi:hypothetical protein